MTDFPYHSRVYDHKEGTEPNLRRGFLASVLRGGGLAAALARAAQIRNSHFGTKRQAPYRIQECPVAVAQLTEKEKVKRRLNNKNDQNRLTSDSDM